MFPRTDDALGSEWCALDDDIKEELERRFFVEILSCFCERGSPTMRVELPLRQEFERLADELKPGSMRIDASVKDRTLVGLLRRELITTIVDLNPVRLVVELAGEDVLSLHDSWSGVLVRLAGEQANQLARRLPRLHDS